MMRMILLPVRGPFWRTVVENCATFILLASSGTFLIKSRDTGHSPRREYKKLGPRCQTESSARSSGRAWPRVGRSAGLRSPLMCWSGSTRQCSLSSSRFDLISPILLQKNGAREDPDFSYIEIEHSESPIKVMLSGGSLHPFTTTFNNLDRSNSPDTSTLGTLVPLLGDTLALAATSLTTTSPVLRVYLQYTAQAQASRDPSQKPARDGGPTAPSGLNDLGKCIVPSCKVSLIRLFQRAAS